MKTLLAVTLSSLLISNANATRPESVVAVAQDPSGSVLYLSSEMPFHEGVCEDKPLAVAVPADDKDDTVVFGCWEASERKGYISVTYLLKDDTPFTDDYPASAFDLTRFGRLMRDQVEVDNGI